jgi:hypothetical protein
MARLNEDWTAAAEKASPAMARDVDTRPRGHAGPELVLDVLRRLGPCSVRRVMDQTGEETGTVRWWLARLEKQGKAKSSRVATSHGGPPRLVWEAVEEKGR